MFFPYPSMRDGAARPFSSTDTAVEIGYPDFDQHLFRSEQKKDTTCFKSCVSLNIVFRMHSDELMYLCIM